MSQETSAFAPDVVRDDFVPKDAYLSQEFARLEEERLWPFVWQVACRMEEIPKVGDFVTYNIVDDSIIVVRSSETEVKAFHNVCSHRGRRLTKGCGAVKQFTCPYHGWQYDLNGKVIKIVDEADWGGCLQKEEAKLQQVNVGMWGGFVFINMDPGCQPLEEFLAPVMERCDNFDFDKLRYRWYKTVIVPANWKVTVEAFTEFYHVQQTHTQLLSALSDYSMSDGFGRHAAMWYPQDTLARSPRLPALAKELTFKEIILEFTEQYNRDLKCMITERSYKATQRLREEVSDAATREEIFASWQKFKVEALEEEGAHWPEHLTPEYFVRSKFDWHVFPNTMFLHPSVESVLWYRVRPNGHDVDSCIFDVWAIESYGPDKAPPLKREFYEDYRNADLPLILRQDMINIPEVHQGMKSSAFKGSRLNPVQERAISNFHTVLRRFLKDPMDHPAVEPQFD